MLKKDICNYFNVKDYLFVIILMLNTDICNYLNVKYRYL